MLNAAQHIPDLFENKLELFQGQICQWEENLERLQVEQFRLRCYMASLQASELPNPKVQRTFSFNITVLWNRPLSVCGSCMSQVPWKAKFSSIKPCDNFIRAPYSVEVYTASVVSRPKQLLVVGCWMRGGGGAV